jgi:hypothetical protein
VSSILPAPLRRSVRPLVAIAAGPATRPSPVAVDTFTHVDVGLARRTVAVAVDTGTQVAVRAPATVAVSVDTATLVKVKALLADVVVDSRTRVGVHVDSRAVNVAVDARTHVEVNLGWFHRALDFGPKFNLRLSLPPALLDPRARLFAPR